MRVSGTVQRLWDNRVAMRSRRCSGRLRRMVRKGNSRSRCENYIKVRCIRIL